jgi:FtsZ-interacting cell division protein ZipA
MTEPYNHDSFNDPPLRAEVPRHRGRSRGAHALTDPRNRQLLIIAGLALLALLIALAIWQSSGTRDAKHDFASASGKVVAKEKEVADARRTLEQKIAELRVVRAEADVQAARLGNAVEQQVGGAVDDARLDAGAAPAIGRVGSTGTTSSPVYYVRDAQGRFVPVSRP